MAAAGGAAPIGMAEAFPAYAQLDAAATAAARKAAAAESVAERQRRENSDGDWSRNFESVSR